MDVLLIIGSVLMHLFYPFTKYGFLQLQSLIETCFGTRRTFADIGATVLDFFGLENITEGESFLNDILQK